MSHAAGEADVTEAPAPGHAEPAIRAKDLTKAYGISNRQAAKAMATDDPAAAVAKAGGFLGARNVNFEIAKGEMFVVMGLSGSGKSTVLRMINRLNEPSLGELWIDDEDIVKMSDRRLRQVRNEKIGMVFQHFSLFGHRTVRDNAAYGLKVRGLDKKERYERADAALARVGLEKSGDKMPHELSGGMRQRVGLARALAVDPPILLMDEPFSALDPLIRRDMQDLLVQLQQEDARTTVFVTHDLNEAMRIGDRIMVMRDGQVIQIGTGVDIVANPADAYVSEFVADVDRARVLTAFDVLRPAKLVLSVDEDPRQALVRLGDNEANGAFVIDRDNRLLGVVTDTELDRAVRSRERDLSRVEGVEFDIVEPGTYIADFMQLTGRRVVPVTVVDENGQLAGVVPRATILSALSNASEDSELAGDSAQPETGARHA